ncbi:uncharacterized protein [Haliotis asinina]|uniref:uncharacterized protein n=1 Tax=Haliotis asinina TaxID=109174 RepID=UPI0035326D47
MMGISRAILSPLEVVTHFIESLLFVLVERYDTYVYTPLQTTLSPAVERVPRSVHVKGQDYVVFSANIVSWARTFLVIPIAACLKYNCCWTAFLLVCLHDFLDHLDGIVAKVQKRTLGQVDDPLLGGFMDAFCDKIVNVLALWSITMVTDFSGMTWTQMVIYLVPCVIIMAYEFILGVVRVQDYFRAYYLREFKKSDDIPCSTTAAIMEGKLKEKLESMGIAFLCLAQSSASGVCTISGITGLVCLTLSIRLAHASLTSKLKARQTDVPRSDVMKDEEDELEKEKGQDKENGRRSTGTQVQPIEEEDLKVDHIKMENNELYEKRTILQDSVPITHLDSRVERVYTVGCFDLFHHGHVKLMQRMRKLGKQVVVGVHDSRSICTLKKRVPIDSTHTRMMNVKQYADVVFCVAGTDPTPYIRAIFDNKTESALYVRGDDMQNFPARELCEKLMTVKFLPYTEGVSSTKLRKEYCNSSQWDSRFDDLNLFY